jgi:hypothetical protein
MYDVALPMLEKLINKDDPTLKKHIASYEELKQYNSAQSSAASPKYETESVNDFETVAL